MVHMVLYTTIILVLITGIWCHDLLFFDEFEYTFDLNNANDWEHYFINTNMDNNDYSSLSKQSSKTNEYINKLYHNEQIINKDKNLFSKLNYAKTCTQTIPLILKQLCVHWKHDQGFKYNYQTPTYSSQIEDTNWYYNNDNNNNNNLQSDAATADKYYSLLDYTYLFNEYTLDFDNDDDWYDVSNDGKLKCSIAIPGFEHKLCVDLSKNMGEDNGAKISFAAADDDDIDYGYYDIYGYDQYYYNIDHLYKHRRRIMDSDSDEYYIDDDAIEQEYYDDNEYGENYEYMQQYK
eukprot:327084_1